MKRTALLAVTCLLALLDAQRSDACSGDPVSGLGIYAPLPAMGTTAPTNTRIWLPQPFEWSAPSIDPATVVITVGTTTIEADATRILVEGEETRELWIFTPTAPLPPGTAVAVKVGTEIVTTFSVEAAADTEPPVVPEILKVEVDGGYFGGFSCPESASVVVTVADAGAIHVLAEGSGPTLPDTVLGMTDFRQVAAFDLEEGDHQLRLLSIDLAGNTTVIAVPELTVPAEQSGCSIVAPGRGGLIVVLALLLPLRRRHGRSS
jgi:hypothetical protein